MFGSSRHARAVVGILAVALLWPAQHSSAVTPGEEARATRQAWQETEAELDSASGTLEEVDAAVLAAGDALAATDSRLTAARSRLRVLRAELRAAKAARHRAERRANDAANLLGQATMVSLATSAALDGHIADLRAQLASAYKYAGSAARLAGILQALQGSGTLTDFLTAYEQLELGAANEHLLVGEITELADRLAEQQAAVAALTVRREAAEARAERERDSAAKLAAEQRRLVAQVAEERASRRRLVARVRKVQAAERDRVEELTAASAALREQLGAYEFVGGAPGTGELAWPTDGRLTSGFGARMHPIFHTRRMHAGVDIGGPTGQEVFAAAAGTVLTAGTRSGYGTTIIVDHGGGLTTVYAHLSALDVSAGDVVTQTEVIGKVGSTGNSTGPHLHFEVRAGGVPRDPMEWF